MTILPTLTQMRLTPTLELAQKIARALAQKPEEILEFDHAVLYAVGNECAGYEGQDRIHGTLNVGCAAIEHPHFGEHARNYVRNYDMLIAISAWNAAFLKSLGSAPVHLCYQGIDTSLFHPAPATGLWQNRFLIFSGGKFEFRKGQDIVVEAFKRFHTRHPESLLVTCWQNLLPLDPRPFQMAGHCQTTPAIDPQKGLQVTPWLLEQGLARGSFIDLPYTPNMLMPSVLRECNAAIFPNRCEGGTNLVAMEAMACGIPTLVSNNTGQKDLTELLGCPSLASQRPVIVPSDHPCVEGWGESDPDEIVKWLEATYTTYEKAKQNSLLVAEKMKRWDWLDQNEKLLTLVCDA